jgi:hypothetical protein
MSTLNTLLLIAGLGALGFGGYLIYQKVKKDQAAQGAPTSQPTGFDALLTGVGQGLASGNFFGSGYNSGSGSGTDFYGADSFLGMA